MTFDDLGLNNNVTEAIRELGYKVPTPIQQQAIPILLNGKDLVGCAQTGTGKTAAFAIPIINTIHRIVGSGKKRKQIRTVVLSPTRELALQIKENFDELSKYTQIKTAVIFGGVSQNPQVQELKSGVDVLVATPGRFLDLYKQGFISLDGMHQLVIDEADLMLDMGFINDVKKIIKLTPSNRHTLLFSATMPLEIRHFADEFLTHADYVSVDAVSSAAETVNQSVYFVDKENKKQLLLHVLKDKQLDNLLIFVRTKHGADNLAKFLSKNNWLAAAFHGDKSQNTRVRVLNEFKNNDIQILIATDVASRGIDIDQLPFVINYEIPNVPEIYIHRIGRTGRKGNTGEAISFVGKDEKSYWTSIEKLMRKQVKVVKDNPFPWSADTAPNPNAKKDFRKKNPTQNNEEKANNKSKPSQSRKSDAAKKNKKRWY